MCGTGRSQCTLGFNVNKFSSFTHTKKCVHSKNRKDVLFMFGYFYIMMLPYEAKIVKHDKQPVQLHCINNGN